MNTFSSCEKLVELKLPSTIQVIKGESIAHCDSLNELYYTTGELIHNSSNDVEYGLSTDSLIINDFISSTNDVY